MRLSVQENDPGYSPLAFGTKVYLNGEELRECITADEERGYALVYTLGADGRPFIPAGWDAVAIHSVRGDVRIVPSAAYVAALTSP